jgi:trimethylamine--corrinoid protein Co-methyltransferase
MSRTQREGVLVTPHRRLTDEQIKLIDGISRDLLEEPGLLCDNAAAAEIFRSAGAKTEDADGCVRIRIPSSIIDKVLETAPSKIVLGAREPSNRLVLDAHEPRVRFGSGSETNVWLDVKFEGTVPKFTRQPGSVERLCNSAHLCENLENLDFFIRNVNIQDEEITEANKDVNKFFASLNNISKHVQGGLTSLGALDDVVRMGQIIAGGEDSFRENPVLSFITCLIKSPLQTVDDTTSKLIEISKRRVPVVISSCPMGGATAPFDEFGMVVQVNAEVLAGVALNQLVAPGSPVLYGACPIRTRLDNLYDMYGAAEFVHYNIDCAEMARFYGLPCYSTAGVADVSVPGIQATTEKMLTLVTVPHSGPQYVHYAFGLLERTNVFCPEQAILDDAQIDLVKQTLQDPPINEQHRQEVLSLVREVMDSSHRTYMYHLPLPSRDPVYVRYPLEDEDAGALAAAHRRCQEILGRPRNQLPAGLQNDILSTVPGILPATLAESKKAAT